jgi:hypothetical protein
VPLTLASTLLPRRTWLGAGPLFHIHLHAKAERGLSTRTLAAAARPVTTRPPTQRLEALLDSLERAVSATAWRPRGDWAGYYDEQASYTDETFARKKDVVSAWLTRVRAATVWDLGANTGEYSRAAREVVPQVVAFDLDPAAVERNYRAVRDRGETGILPLLMDLTNPSPAQGWAHRERLSLEERGPADVLLALALVHHLAIGHNLPLGRIAAFLARLGRRLVIEFVPKGDSQVEFLLQNRPDIFPEYTREGFEAAFGRHFRICAAESVRESERVLYLMETSGAGAGA